MDIGHVIVGGCGHLGRRIAEELSARGFTVVAIERQVEGCPCGQGYLVIAGDLCDEAVLLEAGVETAHSFLAVTGDDRTNLEASVVARRLAPDLRTIVRLFDQGMAHSVERAFGVQVLSSSFLALPAYLAAATEDAVMAAFEIDGRQINLSSQATSGAGAFISLTDSRLSLCADRPDGPHLYASLGALGQPALRRRPLQRIALGPLFAAFHPRNLAAGLRALWQNAAMITRRLLLALVVVVLLSVVIFSTVGRMSVLDAFYFVVTTLTTVGYGDINLLAASPALKAYGIVMMLCGAALLATVYAIIADTVLTARIEYLLGRRAVSQANHIVIVGLGKVGYRVARALHLLGYPTVAVEANEDSDQVSAARLTMPVIIGNAARGSVLSKAGVERAHTILALTDDPMLNLSVVLHAREANPEIRTVVRVYDSHFAERLQQFNLDAVLSATAVSAPVFANAAIYPGVEGSLQVEGRDILVVRHPVTEHSPLAGLTAEEIGARLGIAVVLTGHDGEYTLAKPEHVLTEGEAAVLLVTREQIASAV